MLKKGKWAAVKLLMLAVVLFAGLGVSSLPAAAAEAVIQVDKKTLSPGQTARLIVTADPAKLQPREYDLAEVWFEMIALEDGAKVKQSLPVNLWYEPGTKQFEGELAYEAYFEDLLGEWKVQSIQFYQDTGEPVYAVYNSALYKEGSMADLNSGIITVLGKGGWKQSGGKWFHQQANGQFTAGWLLDNGKWYFLDPLTGVMKTGWLLDGGKWYYLTASGAMKTGWLQEGTSWYYLNSSGAMQTGWQKIGLKWYYFYANGKMAVNTIVNGYKINGNGEWVR